MSNFLLFFSLSIFLQILAKQMIATLKLLSFSLPLVVFLRKDGKKKMRFKEKLLEETGSLSFNHISVASHSNKIQIVLTGVQFIAPSIRMVVDRGFKSFEPMLSGKKCVLVRPCGVSAIRKGLFGGGVSASGFRCCGSGIGVKASKC